MVKACCLLLPVFEFEHVSVSSGSLQMVDSPMLLICTTVHRAHGRLLSLVWRALLLQAHQLGTWPYSRGVQVMSSFILFVEGLLSVFVVCW